MYRFYQWAAFFYIYCICGWIWESSYVSVCERRLVNRGFLHGPVIPLYYSGGSYALAEKWSELYRNPDGVYFLYHIAAAS